jgi:AcrR family transcriptional regulator
MSTQSVQSIKPDGRRLRSDRSRQLIVKSMLDLIHAGNLQPTAQQVADHAKVGIRSVFRHFEDMESIFASVDKLVRKESHALYGNKACTGSLQERIAFAVKQSVKIYEAMSNVMLSSQARLWSSPTVKKNYLEHQEGLRSNIKTWLPEILHLPPNKYQSVLAVCSFDFWYRLRYYQQQSVTDSTDVIIELIENLTSDH